MSTGNGGRKMGKEREGKKGGGRGRRRKERERKGDEEGRGGKGCIMAFLGGGSGRPCDLSTPDSLNRR